MTDLISLDEILNRKIAPIPKGTLFVVTSGEYSNYHVLGTFRALKDLPIPALLAAHIEENPAQQNRGRFNNNAFLAWAIQVEYCELVDCPELHLGSYGYLDVCCHALEEEAAR